MVKKYSTPAERSYQEDVNEALDILWDTAQRIVVQIREFKPDVVVSLLHSGWAPAKAARMLWNATQLTSFPPMVKTNLGREKLKAYLGGSSRIGDDPFLSLHAEPFRAGHFLAWLVQQHGWQRELREQVQAQLPPGSIPERIMLVDDWIAEGSTFILALGLMDILYPGAEKHFVAGILSWKRGIERLWLERYHHQLLERIEGGPEKGGFNEEERHFFEAHLLRLITGTEDLDPFSLEWQPVAISSPMVSQLSAYLPAEEWLSLPRFVEKLTDDHIRKCIQEYQRGMLEDVSLDNLKKGDNFSKLPLELLILRDLWINEQGISRRWIVEKYKLSPYQVMRLLRDMQHRGLLIRIGRGRLTRYSLPSGALLTNPV